MAHQRTTWQPDEWQRWINRLLYAHYRHDGYQPVPDRHRGDYGMEGFSRDGCVYQAYAAQDFFSTNDLYEKQRDKITRDLKKFVENVDPLSRIFGSLKVRRWVLVVPEYDSARLVEHCGVKGEEVKRLQLGYVAQEFAVHVCTDEPWTVEAAQLARAGATSLSVDAPAPKPEELNDWAGAHTSSVDKLQRKASRLTKGKGAEATAQFVRGTIRDYIKGQNAYEELRTNFPEVCDVILQAKNAVEEQLETECAIATGSAPVTYRAVQEKYTRRLNEELKLTPQLAEELTKEALADWLLRCPLNFYEEEDGSR